MARNYESYLGGLPMAHEEFDRSFSPAEMRIALSDKQFTEIDTELNKELITVADEAINPIEVRAYSGDDWVVWRLAGADDHFTGTRTAHLPENQTLIAGYAGLSPFQQLVVTEYAQDFVLHKLGLREPGEL